jgi:hypothetical protein
MIFNRKACNVPALETVQTLLEPLSEILPGVVNMVVQNSSGGCTLDLGAQVLLRGLIEWRNKFVEAEVMSALGRQEQSLTEVRSRESQQNKTILELQNMVIRLEQSIEEQKLEKEFYQKTIEDQNSIIAEQHDRLIALLGHTRS